MQLLNWKTRKGIYSVEQAADDLKSSLPLRQVLCSVNINLLSFLGGLVVSSSSVITDKLEEQSIEHHGKGITPEEVSWIASSLILGVFPSALLSSFFINRLGAKRYLETSCGLFAIGLLLQTLAAQITSVWIICAGRFICGWAFIGSRICTQPYICEISQVRVRGLSGSFLLLFYSAGFAMFILLGALLPLEWALGAPVVLCGICLAGLLGMHESPVWLLKRGRIEEAEQSLVFYNREPAEMAEEIKAISETISKDIDNQRERTFKEKLESGWALICRPKFLRPYFYLQVTFIMMEWSCFPFFAYYLITIFKLTKSPIDPYAASIIAALSRVVSALVAGPVLQRVRKRPLYLTSTLIMSISLAALATLTYLATHEGYAAAVEQLRWLPLMLVLVVYSCFSFGYGNIPHIFQGELFPADARSLGNSMLLFFQFVATFSMVKSAPAVLGVIGISGLFWVFSGVVAFMFFFALVLMPETTGLTLAEIEASYAAQGIRPKKKKEEKAEGEETENEKC